MFGGTRQPRRDHRPGNLQVISECGRILLNGKISRVVISTGSTRNHLRLVSHHLPSVERGVIALFSSLRAEDPSRLFRHRQ
jgi:hypothetical protein